MLRSGVLSISLIVVVGTAALADPTPAPPKAPKELLERRLEAARNVFRQNLARLKGAEALPCELFGWSERWLEADLALAENKTDRSKALRDHLERTREVERAAVSFAKSGQGRQADADAATYYRLEAEIRLHMEDLSEGAEENAKKPLPISLPATVEAYQQVEMYSRVAGQIKTIAVNVGDRVKRGQTLVSLEAPDLELELGRKTALLQQAKAAFNRAKISVRAAQAALDATKALVSEAEAAEEGAKANHAFRLNQVERCRRLLDNKAIEQSVFDESQASLDAAKAAYVASQAKWQAAKATVDESTAKIAGAEADVQVAEAQLAIADADLQRTQSLLQSTLIVAPFDGVITLRTAVVGMFSQPVEQANVKPLVSVARTDLVRIVVLMPESQISQISTGTAATIRFDALPGKEFEGKVSRLSPALNPQTRTLRAEIDLPNPEARLLPGMYGVVTFKL